MSSLEVAAAVSRTARAIYFHTINSSTSPYCTNFKYCSVQGIEKMQFSTSNYLISQEEWGASCMYKYR